MAAPERYIVETTENPFPGLLSDFTFEKGWRRPVSVYEVGVWDEQGSQYRRAEVLGESNEKGLAEQDYEACRDALNSLVASYDLSYDVSDDEEDLEALFCDERP